MISTSRTFLFIFCALTAAAGGLNVGLHPKRLHLFKNAANHLRTITYPVGGKQHEGRRDCHGPHHQIKHDHHHNHGHHHKHGHHKLSFGRAIYQDPYYHVSPQLFYFNKKPLNHAFNQYYSNKFSPYWFTRYNYLPYQMKPLVPSYNYHLKPLYYYLSNPQILTPVPQVTWIKPHHVYPIDNQIASEDSLSVADPLNNPFTSHNVDYSSYEENAMTNAQIPVQDSDLDTDNNKIDENDNVPSVTDIATEDTRTTPIFENKINNNGASTSYNNAEQTTRQYTPIDSDEVNENSTPSVRITGSFDNGKEDTTTPNDFDRVYTTKSDDSFDFGVSDSLRTTVPSYKEKNIENSYSTHEPIAITYSFEHDVTIGNEPSLKDVSEQTVTYSPLEILQNEEILPERGQEVDLEDSVSLITEAEDDDSNGGLEYGTRGETTISGLLETKPNEYHTTNSYDVTSPKIVTEKNEVDLFNYDHTTMDLTTSENPNNEDNVEEYKVSPTQQTLPLSHFEEQTAINSHFSVEASTFSLEPKDQYYTTTESPKKNDMSEHEESPTSQTLSQSSFGESTTMSSDFNDEASFETSDEELLLFEEFIKTIMESVTASPEISYSSELQSKTGMEELNEKTTVRPFIDDATDSSVKESGTDNWRSITIYPAHTSITVSESTPGSNVNRDLENELNLKTTDSSNSFETTTPIPEELNEEESLKDHTIPVTTSSISTDFDGDYEEVPAEKSSMDLSLSVSPMFTDSTEESKNEFSKSQAGIFTTLSQTLIYTDSTEKSREGLSGFKFESNSIPITPSSVYNDFTENYPPSTPTSLKIGSQNFSTNDISSDKTFSDNLDNKLSKSTTTGNIGYKDRIDSTEITTNYYTKGDWNLEESIKSGDEKNNDSKVTGDGISVYEEKSSTTGAWNEKFSIDSSETTTLSSYSSETKEAEFEVIEKIEKEIASVSKMEEMEKQNISDNNIATEKNSLLPGDFIYDSEKYSEDYHIHSNTVTTKIDSIDFEVFQTVEPTTKYQENKRSQTHVSSTETDFGNEKIESIDGFSDSTTTTLEAFDSSTAEYREDINEFSNNISDEENSTTIFEHHGNNKNGIDSIVTTEPSYVTDLNNVKKQSNSEYENKTPTTDTPPAYFHRNVFEEIKNVILSTSVPSDNHYPEVTEANLLYETTSSSRADQYEQITTPPSGTHSQHIIEKLSIGGDDSETFSGEDNAVENDYNDNTDHNDYLASVELTSETNFNSKMNVSNGKLEVEGEPLNENSVNEVKQEESYVNGLNLSQNISKVDENVHSTSPNYFSSVEKNIDQMTVSSEAGTTFNSYSSNQENEEGKDEIVQVLVNDTVHVDNTKKVISELQSNVEDYSDGVIRVYEELDTSFPSSEVALQNEIHKQHETVDEETRVSEELEPVTKGKEQVEEETTEILPLKQFHEPLFIENLNETENQALDIAARNDFMAEVNGVESSTRAQFSDYTEMESIVGENEGEEVMSPNSNSGNDNSPFHLDLLNLNGTVHDDSEEKLSNKSSMIEEVTYYNIKNLEENSSSDNLFVAVNDEETNRTGLLSVDEVIDVNDDDSTNNYELRRSVRYEYDPYLIVSDSTLNVRKPYSNNINYQSDRSAKPRYIVKRDTINSGNSRIPLKSEEFITEKREIENESPAILGRDLPNYQGEEALYDEDEYDYDNDFVPLSIVNPSGLIEEENEEEDDTKLTNDSGPSIIELLKRIT